jgi:hypothetical protein
MLPQWLRRRAGGHSPKKDRPTSPVRVNRADRQAIDDYLATSDKKSGEHLFKGQRPGQGMTTRQAN